MAQAPDNEQYAVRIAPPAYRPVAPPIAQQHPQRQYLIPPPVIAPRAPATANEPDESSLDDESPLDTPHESDNDDIPPPAAPIAPADQLELPYERRPSPPIGPPDEGEVGTGIQAPPVQAPSEPTSTTRAGRQVQRTELGRAAMEALKPKSRKKPQAHPTHTSIDGLSGIYIEPLFYNEAIRRPDADCWINAIDEELNSHCQNCTWFIVHRPSNQKVVGTKWVFRLKDPESLTPRYKARFVAQGFTQIEGIDYNETYASVVKTVSIKQLLAFAALHRVLCIHFDVVTAYLTSKVRKTIYCELPPGYHIDDPKYNDDHVLLLNKALYGLKQSAFEWSDIFRKTMIKLGFIQSTEDDNIYVKGSIIVAIYVDDILILVPTCQEIDNLHEQLAKDFTIRNLGPVKKFLSLDIHRTGDLGDISITMTTYVNRILKKYGMDDANPAKVPCQHSVILHKHIDNEEQLADESDYRSMVSSLKHAAVMLRFDIAYTTSRLAQYLSNPSTIHLSAAKHVFHYLRGYSNLGVTYFSNADDTSTFPSVYADASFALDPDDRKSTTGWLTVYNGGVISHSSKNQDLITLSTMESEYVALCEGVHEAIFQFKLS